MTDAALPPPRLSTRLQWGAALRSLRKLMRDKEDTVAVFEIMRALNGRTTSRGYERLLRTAAGGRLAYERPEIADRLNDDAWLASLPADSLGAAYRGFLRRNGFTPDGLAEVSRVGATPIEQRHPWAWFGRRTRDTHDLWHVVNGYETDGLGEACLVAFSYAQTGGLGWAVIALGALGRAVRFGGRNQARAIVEGHRRGRGAAWLQGEDWEGLLTRPLDEVRAHLRLTEPVAYLAVPPERRNPLAA